MAKSRNNRYRIRVLERAIRLLYALVDGEPRNLTQIAADIELSNPTTFRLLATLEEYRFVQRSPDSSHFRLGPACLELARAYLESIDVRQAAMPILEELREHTQETVHLAVLDQMRVFYLEKLPGFHSLGLMSSSVGSYIPAYCTGLGKALLAHVPAEDVRKYYAEHKLEQITPTTITDVDTLLEQLDEVRQRGYAIDLGEREHEVYCVAAPIRAANGEVIAAISVSGPAYRMESQIEEEGLGRIVHEAARSISILVADRGGRIALPR
ncbi:MAG: IclR family transcriptional regulator [Anaerolineae bacterium]